MPKNINDELERKPNWMAKRLHADFRSSIPCIAADLRAY